MATNPRIESEDLPPEISQGAPASSDEGFEAQIRAFELGLLRRGLHNTNWNQRKTAEILKLSYDQFPPPSTANTNWTKKKP